MNRYEHHSSSFPATFPATLSCHSLLSVVQRPLTASATPSAGPFRRRVHPPRPLSLRLPPTCPAPRPAQPLQSLMKHCARTAPDVSHNFTLCCPGVIFIPCLVSPAPMFSCARASDLRETTVAPSMIVTVACKKAHIPPRTRYLRRRHQLPQRRRNHRCPVLCRTVPAPQFGTLSQVRLSRILLSNPLFLRPAAANHPRRQQARPHTRARLPSPFPDT